MAKVLVVYGTAYGQTERIARRIVDQLTVHGHGCAFTRAMTCRRICWLTNMTPL